MIGGCKQGGGFSNNRGGDPGGAVDDGGWVDDIGIRIGFDVVFDAELVVGGIGEVERWRNDGQRAGLFFVGGMHAAAWRRFCTGNRRHD